MSYNLTNENQETTPLLTKTDLVLAAFSLAEVFNSMLTAFNEEDYGGLTKEEMQLQMNNIRLSFIKFDSMLKAMNEEEDEEQQKEEGGGNEAVIQPESQNEETSS